MGCTPTKFVPRQRRQSLLEIQDSPIKERGQGVNQANKMTKDILILEEANDPFTWYINLEFIKQSKYGSIFKVQHKRNKNIRIMKVINLASEEEEETAQQGKKSQEQLLQPVNSFTKNDLINQMELLKNLTHPNIIQLHEVFSFNKKIFMLYEYCENGDWFEYISRTGPWNENQCKDIIVQLLNALKYCHNKGVIHNALCPEHITIFINNSSSSIWVKIIDFGSFSVIGQGKQVLTSGFKSMNNNLYFSSLDESPSEKSDIWSIGVLIYFILTSQLPFTGENTMELKQNILRNDYLDYLRKCKDDGNPIISDEAKDLIMQWLTINPEDRPDIEQVMKHQWLSSINNENCSSKILKSEAFKNVFTNLKKYAFDNHIKEGLLNFIIHHFAKCEDLDFLRKIFFALDDDNDGNISREELIKGLTYIMDESNAENECKIIFDNWNIWVNYINYYDFLRAAINKDDLINDKNLKQMFELLDKDRSGRLSKKELKLFFYRITKYSNQIQFAQIHEQIAIIILITNNHWSLIALPQRSKRHQKMIFLHNLFLSLIWMGMECLIIMSLRNWCFLANKHSCENDK